MMFWTVWGPCGLETHPLRVFGPRWLTLLPGAGSEDLAVEGGRGAGGALQKEKWSLVVIKFEREEIGFIWAVFFFFFFLF